MFKLLFLFITLLTPAHLSAQYSYTKLRAGFSLEAFGLAPVGMFSGEMPFIYNKKSFWNLQTGIGIVDFTSNTYHPSATSAISFNLILNPIRHSPCAPAPRERSVECYLECGAGVSVSDPARSFMQRTFDINSYFTSLGLVGLRVHVPGQKWIYLFKARATPVLAPRLAPWAGIQVGLGWR